MRRLARVPLVPVLPLALLLAAPALATPSSVAEVTFDEAIATAPITIPVGFGASDLGDINIAGFTLCFRQPTSPSGACDSTGRVTLAENLAAPFFLAGQFRENVATGVKTPVSFPVNLQSGQRLTFLTQWVPDRLGGVSDQLILRGTPTGGVADDIVYSHNGTGVAPGPCFPATNVLCLNNDRFKVKGSFLTSAAAAGTANAVGLTDDTGYLWFFNPNNVEAVVKVLNACPLNNRYWVFAGGLTDVRTVVTVTDTQRNSVRTYVNPSSTPYQPIQDTSAFATCP